MTAFDGLAVGSDVNHEPRCERAMEITKVETSVLEAPAEAVVLGLLADEPLGRAAAALNEACDGLLEELIEREEIATAAEKVTPLLGLRGMAPRQVVCVGLGPRAALDPGVAFRAVGAAARQLSSKERASVAVFLPDDLPPALQEAALAGSMTGCVGQDLYRAEKKRHPFGQLLVDAPQETVASGRALGEGVNLTRRLVNEPADRIYPETFAAEVRRVAEKFHLDCEVWGRERLTAERCGSLLAVARGSAKEPQLAMLHYRGGEGDVPALALIGKGVTFDSGGLSLKPSEGMKTMKSDMAGAATVLGALQAIAALQLPINVSGYMGLVENMTGPDAYRLGDVLTARNGVTIEVHNTDAEGRLVLADALCVAAEAQPEHMIDLATLTGACVVALGTNVAGLMTNDQDWCDEIAAAARDVGEPVWQLPMYDEFDEQIKSGVADIRNTGEGRWGGAITAAKLLERFVDKRSWTHIDIAGPAFADKPLSWCDGGGTGALVRTLVEVARRQSRA